MSVLVGKLTTLIYGDFYCQMQNESKQKRPPWQEVVFRIDENCGRLSPQGGDLVQICRVKASLIKGKVCGIAVESIEDPLMQKIRWLDKLVDELAKGKPLDKILR